MGLTAKQTRTIQALLTAPTQEKAIAIAGVSSTSLQRWMQQPEFVKALEKAQTKLIDDAVRKARGTISPALETLTEIMSDKQINPQIRVMASRGILEFSIKLVELSDILRKLEELESWKEQREHEYLE